MISRLALSSAFLLSLAAPVLAGPCTQRLAELEKSLTAHQEGAGPALSQPSATGSVGQTSSGTNVTAQSQQPSEALRMVQEAKQLDQQGKEAECMAMVPKIESMAPTQTK